MVWIDTWRVVGSGKVLAYFTNKADAEEYAKKYKDLSIKIRKVPIKEFWI